MPTSFDPDTAVSTGLLGATGPVQVTCGPCSIDYFDYTKKDGTIVSRTVAALVTMAPEGEVDEEGNQRSYQQMYSIGDPKTHHPNPDKASFEGPLVKGSNFNFFIEQLINAGFPKHLIAPGDIRVLNGAVLVVEQRKPPARQIAGKTDDSANKPQVVAVKVVHPAPGEEWPVKGKPVTAPAKAAAGGKKAAPKAQAPQTTKAAAPPVAAEASEQVEELATLIVTELIQKAGDTGFTAKDAKGSLAGIGSKAVYSYMKKMQSNPTEFPANLRTEVVKLIQTPEWLMSADRPWVADEESGILVGG